MSLAEHFKREFSATTRQKGESYHRRGCVTDLEADEFGFEAQVRGSEWRPYKVSLEWGDHAEVPLVSCSCPHFEDGFFCKHLWATLLAADKHGITLPAGQPPELSQSYDDFDDDDEYWDSDDDDDFTSNGKFGAGSNLLTGWQSHRRTKQGKQQPKSWDRQLAQLQMSANVPGLPTTTRPKRALFVFDVAASFQAGAVILNLFQQELRKDGQWGKPKVLRVSRGRLSEFSPADQRRLALVLGNYTGAPWTSGSQIPLHAQYDVQTSQVEVVPTLHEWLLPELCTDQSLGWVLSGEQPVEDRYPLVWDAGPPWEFRLIIDDDAKKKSWTARGELAQGASVVPLADAVLLLSSGLVLFPDNLARLSAPQDWRWLALLRSENQLTVPYSDRNKLLAELWAGGPLTNVSLPASLQVGSSTVPPRGCLKVHAEAKQPSGYRYHAPRTGLLHGDVCVDYAGRRLAFDSPQQAILDDGGKQVLVRDRQAEAALWEELSALGIAPHRPLYNGDPTGNVQFKRDRFTDIVETLTKRGWQVWAEKHLIKQASNFHAVVSSGTDWFDLETHVDFGDCQVTLPQLLKALQNHESFVRLDDGSKGILPREWLDRFAPLAEFAEIDGDRMRFRPSQALLLDALLEERADEVAVKVDRQFSRLREKLRSFSGVKPRQAAQGFRGELRPYQKEGLGWIAFLEDFGLNGCLADDMGLGKTVQVLAWLAARSRRRKGRPTLIVAPKSVVMNWQLEAERFTPRLKVLNYTGLGRGELADQIHEAQLVVTTYGTLRRDIDLLKDIQFDYVILDEAQAIKNDKSVSAKACRLLQAEHRLALTGTPVENHLGDLWSIFEFLNPGMLGRSSALQSYANGNGDQKSVDTLRRALAPFILRRTKEKVLKDLPEKTEQTLNVELLPADRKRYNELRDHYRDSIVNRAAKSGMNSVRMHVLEALLRLRQAACHPGLIDKDLIGKPSAKLDLLLDNVAEVVEEGHKALVFSQFTSLLAIVKNALDRRQLRYEYLDGRTRNRQERIDRFQSDPDCPLFLISLKAGGTGLNLTAADYVYLLDPWWNPAVEKQAIDRAHRIGQCRPVFAYRLVSCDTVEEKIIELQSKKRELADAIITGDKSVMSGLTLDDLRLLLS